MTSGVPKLPPILSIGTAVVALVDVRGPDGRPLHPKGSAGILVAAPADPEHSYRMRFPGGAHATRDPGAQPIPERWILTDADPLAEYDLYQHVIYRCVIGSRAYGLDRDGSDVDRRGVYLPPASMHWSVYGVPEQLENDARQECFWELEKFIKLALKANPNVLECLYTPIVEHADEIAQRLRDERRLFLSRLVYQTFNGYAMSQFKKMEQDIRSTGSVKWKHAMHLIRLLRAGIATLHTGELPVKVEPRQREELLAIRDGSLDWAAVDAMRRSLHAEFEHAFERSPLPDRPDYDRANAILIQARAEMARREHLS